MANRMKAKGDKYERDILDFAKAWFPDAIRTKAGNILDKGDIHLSWGLRGRPTAIIQCKDVATPLWREWLDGLRKQTYLAEAEVGFLVVKRRGAGGRPPIHLAVMELEDMLTLVKKAESGSKEERDTAISRS